MHTCLSAQLLNLRMLTLHELVGATHGRTHRRRGHYLRGCSERSPNWSGSLPGGTPAQHKLGHA